MRDELIGYIEKKLKDESKSISIRETSIYGIYNLLGGESMSVLEKHLKIEADENKRNFVKDIIKRIEVKNMTND